MKYFNERKVKVSCRKEQFYNFVNDVRNLGRFIPESLKGGWSASADKCSFLVPGIGEINFVIKEKIPNTKVVFSGYALSRINFDFETLISGENENTCEVDIILKAETDMITGTIVKPQLDALFGSIANEMEKFSEWNV